MTPSQLQGVLAELSPQRWRLILNAAAAEGLISLIDVYLRKQSVINDVPPAVQERLRMEHRRNQIYFSLHMRALSRLSVAFDANRIPFRVLKGAAVGVYAYPDPGARAVGDLDLWVRPIDIDQATDVLRTLGWHQVNNYYPSAFVKTFVGEQEFAPNNSSEAAPYVDLHWHLINDWWLRSSLSIPEQRLFDQKHTIAVKDCTYPTLSPTHTLYHLCLHTKAGYHYQGWRRLLEIHLLANAGAIDWEELNSLSTTSGANTILWRTFQLVDEIFGSTHSGRLSRKPSHWHRFAVERVLLKPVPYGFRALRRTRHQHPLIITLLLLPSTSAIAKMIAQIIWPPGRWLRMRYGLGSKSNMLEARLNHIMRL